MTPEQQRRTVLAWLQRQPDAALRSAVYSLGSLYRPEHLAVLFGMARRA